jgi:hypothetical protein
MMLNHEIAFSDGLLLLRDLSIAASSATLRFRWRSDAGGRSRGHGRIAMGGGGHMFPWGAAAPVIEDDQGNRPTVASGSGGGNDSQWDGELQLQGALSPTTAWLQIEGQRIDLDRQVTPSTTWVEPLPREDVIERFLWRHLAVAEMPFGHPVELEPAIEALTAAGVLTANLPLIAQLQQVSAQMPGRHGRRRGPQPAPPGGAGASPEPWRALFARVGRSDGPSWTHVLGAVSEPFDGIQAAIHSISSDPDGFEAEFEISPNVLHPGALDELPVAWSARDDRGNRHLAHPNGWGGNDESASGTMRFWPALDPSATELQLAISAEQHQAVFSIPLAPLR